MFDAWDGPNWVNCTNNRLTPCDCVAWTVWGGPPAVGCAGENIVGISFGGGARGGAPHHPAGIGINPVGTIATEIGHLSKLTHLNIHTGFINGTIPTELGALTDLGNLYIRGGEE
jgi:hypothetical protein